MFRLLIKYVSRKAASMSRYLKYRIGSKKINTAGLMLIVRLTEKQFFFNPSTEHFTILELHDQAAGVSELHKIHRSTDFEAQIL